MMWYVDVIKQLVVKVRQEEQEQTLLFLDAFLNNINQEIFKNDGTYDFTQITFMLLLIDNMFYKFMDETKKQYSLQEFSQYLLGMVLICAKIGNDSCVIDNKDFLFAISDEKIAHALKLPAALKALSVTENLVFDQILKAPRNLLKVNFNKLLEILFAIPSKELKEEIFHYLFEDMGVNDEFDNFLYDLHYYIQPALSIHCELSQEETLLLRRLSGLLEEQKRLGGSLRREVETIYSKITLAAHYYLNDPDTGSYYYFKNKVLLTLKDFTFNQRNYPSLGVALDKLHYSVFSLGLLHPQINEDLRPLKLSELNFIKTLQYFQKTELYSVLSFFLILLMKDHNLSSKAMFKQQLTVALRKARIALPPKYENNLIKLEFAGISLCTPNQRIRLTHHEKLICDILNNFNELIAKIDDTEIHRNAHLLFATLKNSFEVFLHNRTAIMYQHLCMICEEAISEVTEMIKGEEILFNLIGNFEDALKRIAPKPLMKEASRYTQFPAVADKSSANSPENEGQMKRRLSY